MAGDARRGRGERGTGVALKQFGVGEEVRGLGRRGAGLARALDLRFRRDPVAEREIDPRLHDPRGAVVRIGLERVEQLDPRGADVPRLERRHAALIGGAALPSRRRRSERATHRSHPGEGREP